MGLHREYVHPIEQPVQLPTTQIDHFRTVIPRPGKAILLELLLAKHEAIALPQEQFDLIAPAIAEREEVCAEGIELELFFNEY